MIDKKLTYAVIGASNNPEKYGYKVFKDLLDAEYHVIAINPNEKIILEQKVFPNISAYNKKIDIVIFVVPPKITQSLLPEVFKKKISTIRMQPGSESQNAIKLCKEKNITCIHDACIMIQRKTKQKQK